MSDEPPESRHIVVMGVSGCGKSTVAMGLSERLGYVFGDADRFHPEENIAKMSAGIPLTDADRDSWLHELARWMQQEARHGHCTVMACSALKVAYRDILRSGPAPVEFVHLHGPASVMRSRMTAREGHFMPPALLESQIAALEPLLPHEDGVTLEVTRSPTELVSDVVERLRLHPVHE